MILFLELVTSFEQLNWEQVERDLYVGLLRHSLAPDKVTDSSGKNSCKLVICYWIYCTVLVQMLSLYKLSFFFFNV